MLNLLFMNLIVFATSFLLSKYYFRFESIFDYCISFFVLYLTQIVLTLELLGIFSMLYLRNAIILNLLLLLFVFLIIKAAKAKPKENFSLKFRAAANNLSLNKIQIFCLAVIIGFAIVKIAINLVNPPFGWDSLNYHFTYPVEWLKSGNLDMPISISGDFSVSYYPINGSLFFLWFILPLKNVFLADLGQIPFFVIAFLATYSIARKLNLSKEYAFFSAAILTVMPNYFKQLRIAYVDIMVAALLLSALNYIFLLYKDRSIRNIILYSLALGLVLGTKTTAMPFTLLFFVPFVYFCFSQFAFKKAIPLFILSLILITITGGFSYIRNFIQTHNPLYPLNLEIWRNNIFQGVVDNQMYRTGIRPGDFGLKKILFSEGLGGQTILFLLPAIFLGLPAAIIKKRKQLDFNLVYFLLLPILIALFFRFVIPLPNLRYIYVLFAIGFIIAFYIADLLKIPKKALSISVIICTLASMGEMARRGELTASLIVSIMLFFSLPYLLKILKTKKIFQYSVGIIIIIFTLLIFLEKDYVKDEYPRYVKMVKYSGFWPDAAKAWVWLNDNTTGNNIAYIGRPVPFPLYGTNFKNNVYYVSVNRVEPAKIHYYPGSRYIWGYNGDFPYRNFEGENNYRGRADYQVWLGNLSKQKTDYLFIYSDLLSKEVRFPMEDGWAGAHPEKLELVFKNNTIRIYKIKK